MAFDKDKPASSTSLRNSNPEILANWDAIETANNREHEFSTGGTTADQMHHKRGSARMFSQASSPTTRVDGTAFTAEDLGSLWIDTDNNKIYSLTATTPTWTLLSTEIIATLLTAARVFTDTLGITGDFAVNTNKFTVAGATGDTVVAGTLDVTGNIDPTSYETTNGGFLDEDNMASDAADKIASQQSIKKYIDDQINATVGALTFNPLSENGDAGSAGVTRLSNGFRIARGTQNVSGGAEDTVSPTGFTKVYGATVSVIEDNNSDNFAPKVGNYSGSTFTIRNTNANALNITWIAIGR